LTIFPNIVKDYKTEKAAYLTPFLPISAFFESKTAVFVSFRIFGTGFAYRGRNIKPPQQRIGK